MTALRNPPSGAREMTLSSRSRCSPCALPSGNHHTRGTHHKNSFLFSPLCRGHEGERSNGTSMKKFRMLFQPISTTALSVLWKHRQPQVDEKLLLPTAAGDKCLEVSLHHEHPAPCAVFNGNKQHAKFFFNGFKV